MWSYKYVDGIDFIGLGTHFFPVALPKLPKCFYFKKFGFQHTNVK